MIARHLAPLLVASLGLAACAGQNAPVTSERAAARPAVTAVTNTTTDYSVYDLGSEWRDQNGAALRLGDLAGRVRVVTMVYTSCQSTCPLILAELKRIEAAIPADRRAEVGFVLVSLDPQRDTPGRLAAWAADARLDTTRHTLLVGSDDAVRDLAATLDLRYQQQAGGELAHTNVITVLDREGRIAHRQEGLGASSATAAVANSLAH